MSRRELPPPRWQTPLPPGVAGSWGPRVGEWARRELGIRLDRWQQRALNRALVVDRRDRLLHSHYLVSTARQNGKTVGVRSLAGWGLTELDGPDWSRFLGLAHDRGQARIPYLAVLADLEPIRRRSPRGALTLTRFLGIRSDLGGRHREYHTGSRESRNAIRGESTDVALFDEVRTQTNYDTWAALEPTTTARPEPLIFATSTAGDDRSVLLRDWFDRGIRIIDGAEPFAGFGMTWYAADDELPPDDPRAWLQANPGIADGRLSIATLRKAWFASRASIATFRAERLNLWSEGGDEWLPPGVWRDREAGQPAAGVRVVLAAEAAPSWRRATVAVAIATDAGAWVGVAGELDAARAGDATVSPAQLVELVAKLAREWRAGEVAYSAAGAAAPHLRSWADAARGVTATPLGPREIRAASTLFRSELVGGRLTHSADPLLAQQARVARPSGPLARGDWYLSIRESLGDVDGIRAAAWASWASIAPADPVKIPRIHV